MTKSLVVFLLLLAGLFWQFLGTFKVVDAGYLLVGVIAYYINRNHINILGLIYIVLLVRVIEYVTWFFWETRSAYHIFPVQLLLDFIVILLISKRWEIYLKFNPTANPREIVFTHADYYMKIIYRCYIFATCLAFAEHFARHPYDLGLPESWAQPDMLLIHSNLNVLKYMLNLTEFVVILSMAHETMRSPRVVNA